MNIIRQIFFSIVVAVFAMSGGSPTLRGEESAGVVSWWMEQMAQDARIAQFMQSQAEGITLAGEVLVEKSDRAGRYDYASIEKSYIQEVTPLRLASAEGDAATVRRLLDSGVFVNGRQGYGLDAALFTAVKFGRTEVIELLLRHGVYPDGNGTESTPLMEAALQKNSSAIRILLEAGADPNRATDKGLTAIYYLLMPMSQPAGDDVLAMVELLLAHGADPNPALNVTAAENHRRLTEVLLDAGADPNRQDWTGEVVLLRTVDQGNYELAQYLLDHGATMDAHAIGRYRPRSEGWAFLAAKGFFDPGPLHRAAATGDAMEVRRLLGSGLDVDAIDGNGGTALMHALYGNHAETVRLLLAGGASRTIRDASGWMPAHHAARFADEELFLAVVPDGFAPPTFENSPLKGYPHVEPLLFLAARNGNPGTARILLASGADVNETYSVDEHTALHAAAEKGRLDTVRILVEAGADVNRFSMAGSAPLHLAEANGHREVVEYLLTVGADVHQQGAPLRWHIFCQAVLGNNHTLIERWLGYGYDIDAPAPLGFNALGLACTWRFASRETVEFLLSHGADPNARDGDDFTVTHYVAAARLFEYDHPLFRLLLQHGGDPAACDSHGLTPLHYAAARKNFRAMQLLLDAMAEKDKR